MANFKPVEMRKPIQALEMNNALPPVDAQDILYIDFFLWAAVGGPLDNLAIGIVVVHADAELEARIPVWFTNVFPGTEDIVVVGNPDTSRPERVLVDNRTIGYRGSQPFVVYGH